MQRYRAPWRVEEVVSKRGQSYTIVLEPSRRHATHHGGFTFEAGQFAWIMVGGSPFAVTQHPFSISSSAERTDRVAFTVKAADDFTRP